MPLKGADKAVARIRRFGSGSGGGEIEEVVGAALYAAADVIRAEAYQSIQRGSVSGKNHVPSRPGQPPNNDTGVLASHITVKRTGKLSSEVRSDAPYSAALEYGTSKMAARPFMRPARDKKLKEVSQIVGKQLSEWLAKQK